MMWYWIECFCIIYVNYVNLSGYIYDVIDETIYIQLLGFGWLPIQKSVLESSDKRHYLICYLVHYNALNYFASNNT